MTKPEHPCAEYRTIANEWARECKKLQVEKKQIKDALIGCVKAHKIGRIEPMFIAIEHAENVLADTSPNCDGGNDDGGN